jgi:hypothetical protein
VFRPRFPDFFKRYALFPAAGLHNQTVLEVLQGCPVLFEVDDRRRPAALFIGEELNAVHDFFPFIDFPVNLTAARLQRQGLTSFMLWHSHVRRERVGDKYNFAKMDLTQENLCGAVAIRW